MFSNRYDKLYNVIMGSDADNQLKIFLTLLIKSQVLEHVLFCIQSYVDFYTNINESNQSYSLVKNFFMRLHTVTLEEALVDCTKLYERVKEMGADMQVIDFECQIRHILDLIKTVIFPAVNNMYNNIQNAITRHVKKITGLLVLYDLCDLVKSCQKCSISYVYHQHKNCYHKLCAKCAYLSLIKAKQCIVCKEIRNDETNDISQDDISQDETETNNQDDVINVDNDLAETNSTISYDDNDDNVPIASLTSSTNCDDNATNVLFKEAQSIIQKYSDLNSQNYNDATQDSNDTQIPPNDVPTTSILNIDRDETTIDLFDDFNHDETTDSNHDETTDLFADSLKTLQEIKKEILQESIEEKPSNYFEYEYEDESINKKNNKNIIIIKFEPEPIIFDTPNKKNNNNNDDDDDDDDDDVIFVGGDENAFKPKRPNVKVTRYTKVIVNEIDDTDELRVFCSGCDDIDDELLAKKILFEDDIEEPLAKKIKFSIV